MRAPNTPGGEAGLGTPNCKLPETGFWGCPLRLSKPQGKHLAFSLPSTVLSRIQKKLTAQLPAGTGLAEGDHT